MTQRQLTLIPPTIYYAATHVIVTIGGLSCVGAVECLPEPDRSKALMMLARSPEHYRLATPSWRAILDEAIGGDDVQSSTATG